MAPEVSAERPRVLDEQEGRRLMSISIQNPPQEFVDALRLCVLNKVACSFLPKVPESADILTMQETLDRGGKHELYVAFHVKRRTGTTDGNDADGAAT